MNPLVSRRDLVWIGGGSGAAKSTVAQIIDEAGSGPG